MAPSKALHADGILDAVQVKLTSSDNQMFEVDEEVANQSQTVQNMIEGKVHQQA
jgi:hypothetical protein